MRALCVVLFFLAAAVSALSNIQDTPDYCGTQPVKYNFTRAGLIAGFVWPSGNIEFTCGEVSTKSRTNAQALAITVLCQDSNQGGYARTVIMKTWYSQNYIKPKFHSQCPPGFNYTTIAAYGVAGQGATFPFEVTYNFEAKDVTTGSKPQPIVGADLSASDAKLLTTPTPNYCSVQPVKYTFNRAGLIAGFIWTSPEVSFTCGQVSTNHRSTAQSTGFTVFCKDGSQSWSRTVVLKTWRSSTVLDQTFHAKCPPGFNYTTIAAYAIDGRDAVYPYEVTYNFDATDVKYGSKAKPITGDFP